MPKPTVDADTILKRATPLTGQHAHEVQPFNHLVRMPIALSEHACNESVDLVHGMLELHGERDQPHTLWISARAEVARRA